MEEEEVTKKARTILRYLSKTDMCKILEISRGSIYKKLSDNSWKEYQKTLIEYIYSKMNTHKYITKVSIENKNLIVEYKEKTSIKNIIPF